MVQDVQIVADAALYVPAAHVVHAAEPATPLYVPAAHGVQVNAPALLY